MLALGLLVLPLLHSSAAQQPPANQSQQQIMEQKFDFPPPIQWKMQSQNMEVSVVGAAWGPANSPEMIAKAIDVRGQGSPKLFPDRPYALAICLRAVLPKPTQPQAIQLSGLVRIKNVNGSIEYPSVLTDSGFAGLFVVPAGVNDIPFYGSDTGRQCDFFPVSPEQKEFLFEVIPPSQTPILSFRVLLRDNKFVIVKTSPEVEERLQFTRNYDGRVGADSRLYLQLSVIGPELSGVAPFEVKDKAAWFTGKVDSLGNFKLNEYYPKEQLIGIFDGKFSQDYRQMTGYFSQPDGSGLEPFEFKETDQPGFTGGYAPGVPSCPNSDTPAGWKTYVNQKYRFCFSYPSNYVPIAEPWRAYTEDPEFSREVYEAVQEGRQLQLQDKLHPDAGLCVSVGTDAWDLESLAKGAPMGSESPPAPKIVDDQVFYYYGPGGGGVCYPDEFFYDLRGKPLSIDFLGPCVNDKTPTPETKNIELKLLSTFRTF